VGTEKDWECATEILAKALKSRSIDYFVDEGEGVFYVPKIDIKLRDAIGRLWQGPTIQFDFNLPKRFEMTYVGSDNQEHTPVMIHRAMLGSLERFIGILIEHYAGALPLWLSPVQVQVLPIADRHIEYARSILRKMEEEGFRVDINEERETTQNKIRKAWQMKIPYMLIIGDNEVKSGTVSLRSLSGRDERGIEISTLLARLADEVSSKGAIKF
jgi:threonyl-tRNA synthetase